MELHFVYRTVGKTLFCWPQAHRMINGEVPEDNQNGHGTEELELSNMYKAYVSGLNFHREWPEKIWPKICYRCTNVPPCIGSWNSHWLGKPMEFDHFFVVPPQVPSSRSSTRFKQGGRARAEVLPRPSMVRGIPPIMALYYGIYIHRYQP